jgi:hypothetical protein
VSGEINGGMDLGKMCEGIEFGSRAKELARSTETHRECDGNLEKSAWWVVVSSVHVWSDGAITLSGACMPIFLPFLPRDFCEKSTS